MRPCVDRLSGPPQLIRLFSGNLPHSALLQGLHGLHPSRLCFVPLLRNDLARLGGQSDASCDGACSLVAIDGGTLRARTGHCLHVVRNFDALCGHALVLGQGRTEIRQAVPDQRNLDADLLLHFSGLPVQLHAAPCLRHEGRVLNASGPQPVPFPVRLLWWCSAAVLLVLQDSAGRVQDIDCEQACGRRLRAVDEADVSCPEGGQGDSQRHRGFHRFQ
mmetsp:Transcript_6332/g.14506  ORF Transcript_6332/g.14506 Transcript_6332/m.14506 type:complete len:218 (-) Transcript_6332:170-823(-)